MKLADVHPELSPSMRFKPLPFNNWLVRRLMRFFYSSGMGKTPCDPSVSYTDLPVRNASVRVYTPEGARSGVGVLWIHGGGLILGDLSSGNRICSMYAEELKAVVVSVRYRLAPEHPFPAPLNDCFNAWKWFQEVAPEYAVDPKKIAIAGQSAGGGLAASLCQRIADTKSTQPFAQLLFCPMLDDRTGANRELDSINHLVWNNPSNRTGWKSYLGEHFAAETVPPYAVPARRENVSNLPPAWIGVGELDLFFEENIAYANRLNASGVLCEKELVSEAPHCFEVFAPESQFVKDYFQRHFEFVRRLAGLDGG